MVPQESVGAQALPAPPFLKIRLDAVARLRAAGAFSDEAAAPAIESSQE